MTLNEKQWEFLKCVAKLIQFAEEKGFMLTGGELFRTPEQAALNAQRGTGIRHSVHMDRLAIDLNLFVNGQFQQTSEAHRPLGEYWESLHPLARWGGRFNDGNHYSFEHNGRK